MGVLDEDPLYDDIRFEIIDAAQTKDSKGELEEYELGSHGLVVLDAAGVPVAHLPGHNFTDVEIVEAIAALER